MRMPNESKQQKFTLRIQYVERSCRGLTTDAHLRIQFVEGVLIRLKSGRQCLHPWPLPSRVGSAPYPTIPTRYSFLMESCGLEKKIQKIQNAEARLFGRHLNGNWFKSGNRNGAGDGILQEQKLTNPQPSVQHSSTKCIKPTHEVAVTRNKG